MGSVLHSWARPTQSDSCSCRKRARKKPKRAVYTKHRALASRKVGHAPGAAIGRTWRMRPTLRKFRHMLQMLHQRCQSVLRVIDAQVAVLVRQVEGADENALAIPF